MQFMFEKKDSDRPCTLNVTSSSTSQQVMTLIMAQALIIQIVGTYRVPVSLDFVGWLVSWAGWLIVRSFVDNLSHIETSDVQSTTSWLPFKQSIPCLNKTMVGCYFTGAAAAVQYDTTVCVSRFVRTPQGPPARKPAIPIAKHDGCANPGHQTHHIHKWLYHVYVKQKLTARKYPGQVTR